MLFKPKSIFDILNEAEDDNDSSSTETSNDSNNSSETEENNSDNIDAEADSDNDGDLDVDADLGDEDTATDDINLDSSNNNDSSSDDSSFDSSDNEDNESEPNKANTDIFSSLSAQEQKLKIGKLKKDFGILYSNINDLEEKINVLDEDKIDIKILDRLNSSVYKFKVIIAEYINTVYDNKSYIENKVQYMKFIVIINTINSVVEKVLKQKEI
jgi:hypothetical protein